AHSHKLTCLTYLFLPQIPSRRQEKYVKIPLNFRILSGPPVNRVRNRVVAKTSQTMKQLVNLLSLWYGMGG
ncbi:MAG: hypothetical protein AAB403_15395, partial [Planctomycetota bacterium]